MFPLLVTGTAKVTNVRLNPSFNTLLWDHAAGSGLMYRVILTNSNIGQLIVNETTSTTNLSLPTLQLCQYYTANVTAFTAELHSDTVVTELRVPGGEWVCHAINKIICNHVCWCTQSTMTWTSCQVK